LRRVYAAARRDDDFILLETDPASKAGALTCPSRRDLKPANLLLTAEDHLKVSPSTRNEREINEGEGEGGRRQVMTGLFVVKFVNHSDRQSGTHRTQNRERSARQRWARQGWCTSSGDPSETLGRLRLREARRVSGGPWDASGVTPRR
jgi:hypothetical protein